MLMLSLNSRCWRPVHLTSLSSLLISHSNQISPLLVEHFSPLDYWDVPFLLRNFLFQVGPSFTVRLRILDSFQERTSYKVRCVTSFQKICTISFILCKPWKYYMVSPVRQRQSPYRATDLMRHANDFIIFLDNPLVIQTASKLSLTEAWRDWLWLFITLKTRDI